MRQSDESFVYIANHVSIAKSAQATTVSCTATYYSTRAFDGNDDYNVSGEFLPATYESFDPA
jgi:hypothetical protein